MFIRQVRHEAFRGHAAKDVPLVGAAVGGSVDVVFTKGISALAKKSLPYVEAIRRRNPRRADRTNSGRA